MKNDTEKRWLEKIEQEKLKLPPQLREHAYGFLIQAFYRENAERFAIKDKYNNNVAFNDPIDNSY